MNLVAPDARPGALAYVRFDLRKHDCDCCGATLKKGAVILSDERGYGKDCAARAMGRPKATSRDVKIIEDLRRREQARVLCAEWAVLDATRGTWTWLGKGRLLGDDFTAWGLPDGRELVEVRGLTSVRVLGEKRLDSQVAEDGQRWVPTGLFLLTRAELFAITYPPEGWWTSDRGAEWIRFKGWSA